jgi:hypothetical protein
MNLRESQYGTNSGEKTKEEQAHYTSFLYRLDVQTEEQGDWQYDDGHIADNGEDRETVKCWPDRETRSLELAVPSALNLMQ